MAEAVSVRPARDGDAAAIARLIADGTLTPEAEDPSSPERYVAAIARIRAQGGDVLVAALGDEVVGVCQLMVLAHLQHAGGSMCELESVHVAEAHRSQGIGAALVAEAVAVATARGCYRMQLTSNAVRADAHRFYLAQGFVASHVGFKRDLGE